MPDNNTDDLNTIETTLRDVLAIHVAARAGTIARHHGWPEPSVEQCREMTSVVVRAASAFVRALRQPNARPPSHDELGEVVEGFALGVLEKVMGVPTPDVVH